MSATIRKIGNSSEVIIPGELLRRMNLKNGDLINTSEERNRLVITKAKRCPRYSLEELLAQCDTGVPIPEELNAWDALSPAGDEMLSMC